MWSTLHGIWIDEIPVTPERVWRALNDAGKGHERNESCSNHH